MSIVCNPNLINDCKTCIVFERDFSTLNFQAGLTFPNSYYLFVRDKFNTLYKVLVSVNADGSFDLDPNAFPNGLFGVDTGMTELYLTTDQAGLLQVVMTFAGNPYYCVKLLVDCSPFNYIPVVADIEDHFPVIPVIPLT